MKTINLVGLEFKAEVQQGVTYIQVESILDTYQETRLTFEDWCEVQSINKHVELLTVAQLTSYAQYIRKSNKIAKNHLSSLIPYFLSNNPQLAHVIAMFI